MSEFTNFSLEGKVALVTGASYGIGFACLLYTSPSPRD